MRILYISLDPRQPFNARTGGAMHMREIVRAFREENHEVKVFAPGAYEENDSNSPPQPVPTDMGKKRSLKEVIKKITPSFLWLLARDLGDIRADRHRETEIEAVVDDFNPDVIYERNAYLFASGARVASDRGISYYLELNAPTVEERRAEFGAALEGWHRRVEALQRRVAKGIVVVSEPLQKYLTDSGVDPRKVRVVPNGVRPQRFKGCREEGEKLKEKLGLKGNVIGFVGSLANYHDLGRLLEAMPEVVERFPEAKALVVGGGPLMDEMRALAAKGGLEQAIIFAGSVDPHEVPAYVGAFDVGVLPSTASYCSPIKLFEYGAAGVPIIAPRTVPVASILGSKGEGVLIEDENSLAEAIISLLADSGKASKMGAAFQKRVLNTYTWRNAARRILRLIEETL